MQNHEMEGHGSNIRRDVQMQEVIEIGEAVVVPPDPNTSPKTPRLPNICPSPPGSQKMDHSSEDICVTPDGDDCSSSGYFESSDFAVSNVRNYVSSTELIKSDPLEKVGTVDGYLDPDSQPSTSRLSPLQRLNSPAKCKRDNTVKRVIVLNPGDDPEKATAKAINDIADSLNKKAAERLAQGHTPEKETVIEITRILAPADGYFSKEHFHNKNGSVNLPELKAANQAAPVSSAILNSKKFQWRQKTQCSPDEEIKHQHHRRKSPHPKKHMYTSPTPPKLDPRPPSEQLDSDQWYYASSPRVSQIRPSSPLRHSTPVSQNAGAVRRAASQSLQHSFAVSSVGSCQSGVLPKRGPAINGRGPAILRASVKQPKPPPATSIAASISIAGTSMHNHSLNNIQSLNEHRLINTTDGRPSDIQPSAVEHMEKIRGDYGQKKRPPYSYMHLIQMAICSRNDRKMTLREIYSWIEEKFPYYKFSANQGWKNSIRHNLSLYDIFVREKPKQAGKSSFSYWTLREDIPNVATKAIHDMMSQVNSRQETEKALATVSVPTFDIRTQASHPINNKSRKGPVPLLPKPVAPQVHGQTFALIPIHSGIPVLPSQPMVLSQWQAPNAIPKDSKRRSLERRLISSKRNLSPHEVKEEPCPKHVKRTVGKVNMLSGGLACSLDEWESNRSTPSPIIVSPSLSSSLDTSELRHQLSQIQVDSGIDFVSESSSLSETTPGSSQGSSIQGLPQPTMYTLDTGAVSYIRNDRRCGEDSRSLCDSLLDQGSIHNMLGEIEKDLSSPIKQLLSTPPRDHMPDDNNDMMSSTPFRSSFAGSLWSPIEGLTPLANKSPMDSLLFTPPQATNKRTSTPNEPQTPDALPIPSGQFPDTSPSTRFFTGRLTPVRTPKSSPKSHNNSFSKLLSEYQLDSMIDEGINADVSNLSFSVFQ